MMKKIISITIITILYIASFLSACVLAGLISSFFVKSPAEFPGEYETLVAVLAGLYLLCLLPIVIMVHIIIRNWFANKLLPVIAMPLFGVFFPIIGFYSSSTIWWPERPIDMKIRHLCIFFLTTGSSIAIGLLIVMLSKKLMSNKKINPTSLSWP